MRARIIIFKTNTSNKRPVVLVHRPMRASGVSMGEVGIPSGYQGANHYAVEACLVIFLHFLHAKYKVGWTSWKCNPLRPHPSQGP